MDGNKTSSIPSHDGRTIVNVKPPSCANPICNASSCSEKCPGCKALYCSTACRKEHWSNGHGEECYTSQWRYEKPGSKQFFKLSTSFFALITESKTLNSKIWALADQRKQDEWEPVGVVCSFSSLSQLCSFVVSARTNVQDVGGRMMCSRVSLTTFTEPSGPGLDTSTGKAVFDLAHQLPDHAIVILMAGSNVEEVEVITKAISPQADDACKVQTIMSPSGTGTAARESFYRDVERGIKNAGGTLALHADLQDKLARFVQHGTGFDMHVAAPGGNIGIHAVDDVASEIGPATLRDNDDYDRMRGACIHTISKAFWAANVKWHNLGCICAKLYGRGAFRARFCSMEALYASRAQSLEARIDELEKRILRKWGTSGAGSKQSKSLRSQIMSIVVPCQKGKVDDYVTYVPASVLDKQFDDKDNESLRSFHSYDIDAAVVFCAEVAVSQQDDVITILVPMVHRMDTSII